MPRILLVLLPILLLSACGEPPETIAEATELEQSPGAGDQGVGAAPEDLHRYLNDTHELVEKGQYSAALERYIWFHQHALEHDPSMSGVRLSFALAGWRRLAEVYAPAMAALVETRNRTVEKVRDGAGGWHDFQDVQSLNEALDDESLTVELFEYLHETRPELAQRVWNVAKSEVIAAGRYELAKSHIGNPMHSLASFRRSYERNKANYGEVDGMEDYYREYNENRFVEQTLELMQVFTALGRHDLVDQIGNEALNTFQDPRIEYAMER